MRALFLLLGILLGVYVLKRWADKAGPVKTQQLLRKLAIGFGILLLLFLLTRGGPAAALLLPLLLPLLLNGRSLWRRFAHAGAGGSATQSSQAQSAVETEFLRMSLDHSSGDMQGTVLKGHFAGRELAELSWKELTALWSECRQDAQSMAVLEAYFDRTQDEDWRERVDKYEKQSSAYRGHHNDPMDEMEAFEILGLQHGASPEEIKTAHRRLMQHVHPDHGGSAYLAAKLNQAKDLLLGK